MRQLRTVQRVHRPGSVRLVVSWATAPLDTSVLSRLTAIRLMLPIWRTRPTLAPSAPGAVRVPRLRQSAPTLPSLSRKLRNKRQNVRFAKLVDTAPTAATKWCPAHKALGVPSPKSSQRSARLARINQTTMRLPTTSAYHARLVITAKIRELVVLSPQAIRISARQAISALAESTTSPLAALEALILTI